MNDHRPARKKVSRTRDAAAEALRASEARYRTLFESMGEGFCIVEAEPAQGGAAEDYRLIAVNPAFEAVTGAANALGRTIREVFPGQPQQWLDAYDKVLATGSATRFERSSLGRILEIHAFRVEDGTNRRLGAIFADITARKRLEEARDESERALQRLNETLEDRVEQRTAKLLAREALIRTFFNHSSECHAVLVDAKDGSFRYEEVNPATLRLYKMTREQVIGYTTDELFGEANATEVNMHLAACLRSGKPYRYERRQGDGIVEAIATPVLDEIVPAARIVVSARDVTERRRLEEQLRQAQKMEAIGQLTGGIAHDFNNLLTGIIGSLEMMQRRIAQGRFDTAERYIGAARDAASRAAALTQRLLAFSRRQTLDPKPTDANKLIAGIEALLRQTVGPGTELAIVREDGLWLTRIDASQLENAVLNLTINARDAMPNGGRITIETANKWLDDKTATERDLSPGQYVLVSVADTGTGMTADVMAQAFDPFFTTKPLGQGTGLGLSMIHGFVRQSGGGIRIDSEVGKGTKMYLYLPRIHGETEVRTGTDDFCKAGTGRGEVVLVIDDDLTVRMLMVEVMREAGYVVLDAGDGAAALRILQSDGRMDLLITDVGLPGGMNGRQVADAARTWRPDLKVLFVTGYAENAAIGDGLLEAGMQVITKPFVIGALENKVREMIEG